MICCVMEACRAGAAELRVNANSNSLKELALLKLKLCMAFETRGGTT